MVLLVALVLVGAAAGLLFVGRGNAEPYILACSPCWRWSASSRCSRSPPASCGSPARKAASPLLKAVVDEAIDGILVTDRAAG